MTYEELQAKTQNYYEKTPYCCSESVLKALLEHYQIEHTEDDIALATAFGGGLGSCGCVCGTISGAVLAFGYVFKSQKAPLSAEQIEESQKTGKKPFQITVSTYLTKKLHEKFAENHKKPCCRILKNPYKEDKKAKQVFCSSLNAEVVLYASKLIDEYKSQNPQ